MIPSRPKREHVTSGQLADKKARLHLADSDIENVQRVSTRPDYGTWAILTVSVAHFDRRPSSASTSSDGVHRLSVNNCLAFIIEFRRKYCHWLFVYLYFRISLIAAPSSTFIHWARTVRPEASWFDSEGDEALRKRIPVSFMQTHSSQTLLFDSGGNHHLHRVRRSGFGDDESRIESP